MQHPADSFTGTDRHRCAREAFLALLARYRGGCLDLGEQELLDTLSCDAPEGTGLLAGISELSVSFRAGFPIAIRALSEVLHRRKLDAGLASAARGWGTNMLRHASAYARASYASPIFHRIYDMLYRCHGVQAAEPFRFGIATEFGGALPVLKFYFDLHANNKNGDERSVECIASILGETNSLNSWKRAWPGLNVQRSRVIGVDFGAANAVRAKFYWGARHLTWDSIMAAAHEISGARHVETLNRLSREVCGAADSLSHVLVSMCARSGTYSMKIDVCVARLYQNDEQACEGLTRFLGPSVDCRTPLGIVSKGLEARQTKCVQQYLGVELPPIEGSRVTVYYRPIGLETEHLNTALHPRVVSQ